jgi:putative ABC transport system substrate-binding protein
VLFISPNLGALCAFARDIIFRSIFHPQNFKYLWLDFGFSIGRSKSPGAFAIALYAMLYAFCSSAEAQPRGKIPRIGILEPGRATNVCNDGLRQGMRTLGYVEGQNLVIESRYAEWKPDRLEHFAGELTQLKPDAIWTHGPTTVRALKRATSTIPIILGVSRNLVELGIVASLARPGGNITGMDLRDDEIIGKRLELLKEALPKTSRVAVLVDPHDAGHANIPKNMQQEAHALRVKLQRVEARGPEDFDEAFAAIVQDQADALILPESPMLSQNRQRIFKIAISKRLPTAAGGSHFAEAGSLMSYGASVFDVCQRSALFVDKVLKGRKPVDLPVERPTKFELVINLRTAKQIGLTISPNVLARADRVIK